MRRCWWAAGDDLLGSYHDSEWGKPVADDRTLFEKLCLEGFQSGLSWLTILRKRENFRAAFAGFDAERIAAFGPRDIDRLMGDAGIVRNRAKIESTINNARRLLELDGGLAAHLWRYEPPRRRTRLDHAELIQRTTCPEAVALAKDLRSRGWRFLGPTTVYAAMEAMGLVNDHLTGCPMRAALERERAAFARPG